ncbi:MAG: isoprenylcysteine carboxylmethyltransferase family protein [Anaerolineales bacterium]|nr:isoprenylcysteine carboxylmethyltransferase family protein [Anaerolineales bacterium]
MKQSRFFGGILVASALIVAQYVLAFFIYKLPGLPALQWIGWGIWALSVFFGIAPILIFRRRGGVAKGKSYVETTQLVDTSLYAIVRHPQYLAGILFNMSMMLLAQHWLVILLGLISAVLIYMDIQAADREGIEKFGDEYRRYMQRVPQVNFLLGGVRILQRKKNGNAPRA